MIFTNQAPKYDQVILCPRKLNLFRELVRNSKGETTIKPFLEIRSKAGRNAADSKEVNDVKRL